jgi:hypothetical protein
MEGRESASVAIRSRPSPLSDSQQKQRTNKGLKPYHGQGREAHRQAHLVEIGASGGRLSSWLGPVPPTRSGRSGGPPHAAQLCKRDLYLEPFKFSCVIWFVLQPRCRTISTRVCLLLTLAEGQSIANPLSLRSAALLLPLALLRAAELQYSILPPEWASTR